MQRAQGDRSQDELKVLNKEIDALKLNLQDEEKNFSSLVKSNKQLIDEIRMVERAYTKISDEMNHFTM